MSKDIFTKHDTGKPELALLSNLPLQEVLEIAEVIEFGAKKYSRDNWKKGTNWLRLCSSMLRHAFAFMQGEDIDQESGKSHLAHLGCNLLFLMYYRSNKIGKDDRLLDKGE